MIQNGVFLYNLFHTFIITHHNMLLMNMQYILTEYLTMYEKICKI